MKRILPILVVGILVLTGLGAVALDSDEKKSEYESVTIDRLDDRGRDYTHTVLVEVGTATWCPSCPGANTAWHNIYEGGQYDFEYTEMVVDKNSKANARMNQYNLYWLPTSYFDGGQFVTTGSNTNTFKNNLNSAGSRSVPDLDAEISANWLGNAEVEISFSVENNDNNDYPGRLRVYIIELESPRYFDNIGNPYYHAYLDTIWDQTIDIDSGDTLEDTKVWDGAAAGYSNVEPDNLQVILAVFDDTAHTSYSDPPSGAPFNAYYVDETVATYLDVNQAPNKPTITGPAIGSPGEELEYTISATDAEDEDVYLFIDWRHGTQGWLGPYASGEEVILPHTFDDVGIYEVKAKARDVNLNEGDWSTYIVAIGDVAPSDPFIYGRSTGNVGESYKYTFDSEDPGDFEIYYYIKWGDGETEEWIGPYESGEEVELHHTWTTEGDYTIEAQTKNTYDVQSGWSTKEVSMPRGKITFNTMFLRILERFPHAFPLLRHIILGL